MVYTGSSGPKKFNLWIYCGQCNREFEMHHSAHFGSPVVEMVQESPPIDMWTSRLGNVTTYRNDAPTVTFTLKSGEQFTVDEFIQPVIDGDKWHYEV